MSVRERRLVFTRRSRSCADGAPADRYTCCPREKQTAETPGSVLQPSGVSAARRVSAGPFCLGFWPRSSPRSADSERGETSLLFLRALRSPLLGLPHVRSRPTLLLGILRGAESAGEPKERRASLPKKSRRCPMQCATAKTPSPPPCPNYRNASGFGRRGRGAKTHAADDPSDPPATLAGPRG